MYSSFENQLTNLLRYGFSFALLFILGPRILFTENGEKGLERFFSGYVKSVCIIIAVGYILVLTKLYEIISLVTVFLGLFIYNRYFKTDENGNLREDGLKIILLIFDFLDGKIGFAGITARERENIRKVIRNWTIRYFGTAADGGNTVLLAAVLLYSAYLRFYDSILHAAPAMSDGSVTLAWMKYIGERILFHDGIYPQGFHIYLATLHKFAFNDPLYTLKYTGPLNGVLTVLGIYFFVSRLTGRDVPGIISAFIYGALVGSIHMEWARQAATNSQEFALVFLFPGWYFTYKYLKAKNRHDFWTAFAAFVIIGWSHAVVFAFLSIGVGCLLAASLATDRRTSFKPVCNIFLAGVAAGILAVLPALVGLIMKKPFFAASVDFLLSQASVTVPNLSRADVTALAGFGLLLVVTAIKRRNMDWNAVIFFVLLAIVSLAIYMFLGPVTGSAMMVSRMILLWGLVITLGLGLGWYALLEIIPEAVIKRFPEKVLCAVILAGIVLLVKPVPAVPYKMQYDIAVEQYLRISGSLLPTEWTIVSEEEGYALALGKGYHIMLGNFLRWYNPTDKILSRVVNGHKEKLDTPDIFVFKEKKIFRVNELSLQPIMKPIITRRTREYRMLDEWMKKYTATHKNWSIYYEDTDLQVIRIHRTETRDRVFQDIWRNRR